VFGPTGVPNALLPSLSNRKSEENRISEIGEGSNRSKIHQKWTKIDQNWTKGTPKQAEFEDPLEIEVGRKSGIAGALNLIIEYASLGSVLHIDGWRHPEVGSRRSHSHFRYKWGPIGEIGRRMGRKPRICGGNRWNCEFIANGKPSNVQNLRMWSARTHNGPCTSRRPASQR
jgi:hypothetical protein